MSKSWKRVKESLYRNKHSGIYYAIPKVDGKKVFRSLDTNLRSIADIALPIKLAEIRAGAGVLSGPGLTLGECAAIYLQRKQDRGYRRKNQQGQEQSKSKPLKPRSMDYRRETVDALKGLWEGFDAELAAFVTEVRCHAIADKVRRKYSATRFNGIMQSLRGILAVAVESHALQSNPAMSVSFADIKPSDKPIPSREQMTEILRLLDSHPRRNFARLSIRAMAFTGLRPNEARNLASSDIDLAASTLTARTTKNGKPRTIQLIQQAIDLFKDEGVDAVLKALKKDPRRAIRTIGDIIGVKMTPYTMRHLHMTALMESGIDIHTAALIAGQQDRGVTLLKHYLHGRTAHMREQLGKVVI